MFLVLLLFTLFVMLFILWDWPHLASHCESHRNVVVCSKVWSSYRDSFVDYISLLTNLKSFSELVLFLLLCFRKNSCLALSLSLSFFLFLKKIFYFFEVFLKWHIFYFVMILTNMHPFFSPFVVLTWQLGWAATRVDFPDCSARWWHRRLFEGEASNTSLCANFSIVRTCSYWEF